VTVSLGSETDGSILCPASVNGVVGIKPTVGLTSRAGVIPIAHSQDTVGPFARTVADAATVLTAIAGADAHDTATDRRPATPVDYAAALDPNTLRGARIGVAREAYFGYNPATDAIAEAAIQTMRALGATIIDPADIPTAKEMSASEAELTVLLYEFKADLNAYLAALQSDAPVHSLADLIAFNEAHAAEEMPYFGQELVLLAQEKGPLTEQVYLDALAEDHRLSRAEGIDAILERERLDALVMPTGGPSWKIDLVAGDHHTGGSSQPAALAGYPAISVPMGYVSGLPVGLTFMGAAYSEARLIRLAYAFEQATLARRPPRYTLQTP
jgi:amidase